MKIKLLDKTYVAPKAKARLFRDALEIIQEKDLNHLTPDTLDELLQFVCNVFDKAFSIDEIYDGYASGDLVGLITEAIGHVVGKENLDEKK